MSNRLRGFHPKKPNRAERKAYSRQCERIQKCASKWFAEHPNPDVSIVFSFGPDICVIANISDAIQRGLVHVNEQGLDLIHSLGDWGTDDEPTVLQVRVVVEHEMERSLKRRLNAIDCPHCGGKLDEHGGDPHEGALGVCISCLGLLTYHRVGERLAAEKANEAGLPEKVREAFESVRVKMREKYPDKYK